MAETAEAQDKSTQEVYEQALKLDAEGKRDEALEKYTSVLASHPDHSQALLRRGIVYAKESLLNDALTDWVKAFDVDPELHRQILEEEIDEELRKHVEAAVNHFAFETTIDPKDASVHLLHGKACRLFGRDTSALSAFSRAKALDPSLTEAIEGAALMQDKLGETESALEGFASALESNPNSPELNYKAGLLYRKTNKTALAIKHLEKAASLEPKNAKPILALGEIFLSQGRHEEADAKLKQAQDLAPGDVDILLARAECCRQTYRFDLALQMFEQAVTENPGNARLLSEYGNMCLQMGEVDKGIGALEQALEVSPNSPEIHVRVGRAYQQKQQVEKAHHHYGQALSLNQRNDSAAFNLALTSFALGKPREALEAIRKAVEINPADITYRAQLGRFLAAVGEHEEAVTQLSEAARANPNNIETQILLGQACLQAGHHERAVEAFTLATRLDPNRVEGHHNLGMAHLAREEFEEAQTAFKDAIKQSETPHAPSLFGLGQVYRRKGLDDISLDFYKQSLESDPNYRASAHALASKALEDGGDQELMSIFEQTLEPHAGELARAGLLVGAWKSFLEPKHRYDLCIEMLDRLLNHFPGQPEILREQARLHFTWATHAQQNEGVDAAIAALERLQATQPGLPELEQRLAKLREMTDSDAARAAVVSEVPFDDEPAAEAPAGEEAPEPAEDEGKAPAEASAEAEAEVAAEASAEAEAEVPAEAAAEPEVEAPAEAAAEPEAEVPAEAAAEPEVEAPAEAAAEPEVEAPAEAAAEPEVEAPAEPEAVAEPEALAEPAAPPEPPIAASAPEVLVTALPAPAAVPVPAASLVIAEQLQRLQGLATSPTWHRSWERAAGEYLLANAHLRRPAPLRGDPDQLASLYFEFAGRLRDEGWFDEAATLVAMGLRHDPDSEAGRKLSVQITGSWAGALIESNRFADAVGLYEGLLELYPDNQTARDGLTGTCRRWAAWAQQQGDTRAAAEIEAWMTSRGLHHEELVSRLREATARRTQSAETVQTAARQGFEAAMAAEAAPEAEPVGEAPVPEEPVVEPGEPVSEVVAAQESFQESEEPATTAEPEGEEAAPEPEEEPAAEEPAEGASTPAEEPSEAAPEPAQEPAAVATDAPDSLDAARSRLLADPDDQAAREGAYALLAEDRKALVKFFRDVANEQGDEPAHILNLARAYAHTGSDTLAVIQYQKYVKQRPSLVGYNELAETYDRLGKTDLAELIRKKAAKLEENQE